MQTEQREPQAPPPDVAHQLLKLALEIGPLLVLFMSNAWAGLQFATKAFMVASVISLVLSRWLLGKFAVMPLVATVPVLIFGGLTVWLEDDLFIKLKLTIVNLLFGGALIVGLFFGHSLLKHVFAESFQLTDEGWSILTRRWAYFFLIVAALNEIVWRNFSSDTWVAFKSFAVLPLSLVFAVSQVGLIRRYELPSSDRTLEKS